MQLPASLDFATIREVDQLGQLLDDWQIDSMQLDEGEHEAISERVMFPDLVVERAFQNIAKKDEYRIPSDKTLFCLFKPGAETGHWCGFDVADDVLLVNQSTRDHFAVLPAGLEHVSILVDNDLVAAWELLPGTQVDSRAISQRALIPLLGLKAHEFRSWLFGQFESRNNLHSLTFDRTEAGLFRERVLDGLSLLSESGRASQGYCQTNRRQSRRYDLVKRACQVVDDRIHEKLTTTDVAETVGANIRALQRGFASVLGTTAFDYLVKRKLRAVRRELISSSRADTTVSQVAMNYGFTELGRFSVRYRQMFGELPSNTLKRRG